MPEAQAAAVATAATPAAPAVVAQPMVAAKPVAGETFAQQMERYGGFTNADGSPAVHDGEPGTPAPDAADSKLAKGKKGKKAAKAAAGSVAAAVQAAPAAAQAAAAPAVDKLAQLKALATELEMDVDGQLVTARERVEFREAKKKLNARIQQQEREVLSRLEQAKQQFSGQLGHAERIVNAANAGDYEGLAQLLGKKDWNALQEDVIAQLSDPNYKRLKELERRDAEREAEKQRFSAQRERENFAQQQNQARINHVANLQTQMKASSDPLVSAMHDDPQFIAAVIEVQRQNWDPVARTTVTPEKAIKIAAQGFQAPLQQHMRALYDRLQKVFGATPAQAAAVVQAVSPAAGTVATPPAESKKNKTAVVPAAATAGAPSAAKTKLSRKEMDKMFSERLAAAIAEENLGG